MDVSVRKIACSLPVDMVDGVPQCPHGCGPMRDRGDGQWDCPVWGPVWDEAARWASDVLDPMLLVQPK